MGVALDTNPELEVWLVVDTLIAAIFVAEAIWERFESKEPKVGTKRIVFSESNMCHFLS